MTPVKKKIVAPDNRREPDPVFTSDVFDEFVGFGLSKTTTIRPLHERCIAIAAEPGVGKSALAQSEPNAIVIDVDQAGLVNPNPRALLAPGVGEKIDIPHPREPDKRVTSMGFDYVRAVVKRAIEVKKSRPELPITIWFDTMSSLIEARIRKLESDTERPFDMHDGRRVWPIIGRNITDLIDECKEHGIGTRLCFHVTSSKETKQMQDPITKQRTEISVKERAVNIAPSLFKSLTQRFDEGFILKTRVIHEAKTKTLPNGKIVKIGEETNRVYYLEVDKDSEYDTIQDFSKTKIRDLPRVIQWNEGDFDPWVSTVAPAFASAIETFENEQKEDTE